jgi:simple sugar transport system ATP-binding protein
MYPAEGKLVLDGKELPLNNALEALRSGMAFVSEDRRGVGLLLDESIETNMTVTAMQCQEKFLRRMGIFLAYGGANRRHALKMIRDLDIRCTGTEQIVRRLSGGNQQKGCIAKAFTLEPRLIFVSEPTRGIDVGAKKIVLDLLVRLNRRWASPW